MYYVLGAGDTAVHKTVSVLTVLLFSGGKNDTLTTPQTPPPQIYI